MKLGVTVVQARGASSAGEGSGVGMAELRPRRARVVIRAVVKYMVVCFNEDGLRVLNQCWLEARF